MEAARANRPAIKVEVGDGFAFGLFIVASKTLRWNSRLLFSRQIELWNQGIRHKRQLGGTYQYIAPTPLPGIAMTDHDAFTRAHPICVMELVSRDELS